VVTEYLNSKSADILFLQEVPWVIYKPIKKSKFPGKKANTLFDHLNLNATERYELNPTTKPEGWPAEKSVRNCVIYDKQKFEDWSIDEKIIYKCYEYMSEDGLKGAKTRLKSKHPVENSPIYNLVNKRYMLCFIGLKVKKVENSKFIAACIHNYRKSKRLYQKQKNKRKILYPKISGMAKIVCKFIALLSEESCCPVLLAGDFNTDIKKLSTLHIHPYDLTDHRLRKKTDNKKIDFFLSKKTDECIISLKDVKAELAIKSAAYDSQDMETLDRVSNHDPLSATLSIKTLKQKNKIEKPNDATVTDTQQRKKPPATLKRASPQIQKSAVSDSDSS